MKQHGRWNALRAFHSHTFRQLWAGIIVNGLAVWINRLTVGWFVFTQTNSAFLTTVSFTMQSAPGLVVAPFGGAIADRLDRRLVLAGAAFVKGLTALGLAFVAIDGIESVWWYVIVLLAVAGAVNNFELPASQALIPDVVGLKDAMNGIAVCCSVGLRAISAVGALVGGFLLEIYGASTAFATAAILHWVAAAVVIRLNIPVRTEKPDTEHRSVFADIRDGLQTVSTYQRCAPC